MPGLTTTRLPYTDFYTTIRKAKNSEWQNSGKQYQQTTLDQSFTKVVGNMKLS